MQTIIKGGPTDLIAYAWFRIGYRPRESVVLVGIHGPRQRSGVVARVDLPPPAHRHAAMRQLLTMLTRAGDDALLALIVSDAPRRVSRLGETQLPHRALVKTLRAQARQLGVDVIDVLAVGPDDFRSYLCRDPRCCPPDGRPLSEVMTSRMAAHMVLDGRVVADDEAAIVADVIPDPDSDPEGEEAEPEDEPEDEQEDEDGAGFTQAQRREMLAAWRTLLDDAAPSDDGREPVAPRPGVLWLALALQDALFRDAVILSLVAGPARAGEPACRDYAHALLTARGADLDGAISGALNSAEPVEEWLERGRVVLSAVARQAPAGCRGAALAVLAWVAWWAGIGARARLLAERALDDQPENRLAALVDELLVASVPPPWALRNLHALREDVG